MVVPDVTPAPMKKATRIAISSFLYLQAKKK